MSRQAPSGQSRWPCAWYDFQLLDFRSQRKEGKLDGKQSGRRVLPRRSCRPCLCSQTVPQALSPCPAGARPGGLFASESEVFHGRGSDQEETGRGCGRRGPRAPGLWAVAAAGRALHGPTTGPGWTLARSRGFPSRRLLGLALPNASVLRPRKGVVRPPSPALRRKRHFGLVQGRSRDTGTSLARSRR